MKYLLIIFTIIGSNNPLWAQMDSSDILLNDLNPENFNQDFSNYDQSTAIYCAQLSEISYWNCTKVKTVVDGLNKRYLNNKHHHEFLEDKKSGTQLLLFGTSDYMILAFRGTEFTKEVKDIILDAKLFSYYQDSGYSELPAGHGGFRKGIMNLMDNQNLIQRLSDFRIKCNSNKIANFPVYTTGHSLGAALATLIIKPLTIEKFNFMFKTWRRGFLNFLFQSV